MLPRCATEKQARTHGSVEDTGGRVLAGQEAYRGLSSVEPEPIYGRHGVAAGLKTEACGDRFVFLETSLVGTTSDDSEALDNALTDVKNSPLLPRERRAGC
jgi:hypothetical protein